MSDSISVSCVLRLLYEDRRNGVSSCHTYVVLLDARIGLDSMRDIVCERIMKLGCTSAGLSPLGLVARRHHSSLI